MRLKILKNYCTRLIQRPNANLTYVCIMHSQYYISERFNSYEYVCLLMQREFVRTTCFSIICVILIALSEVNYLVEYCVWLIWREIALWAAGEEVALLILTAFSSQHLHTSQMLFWSQQSHFRSSCCWNHNWISLLAPSSESLAWTTFLWITKTQAVASHVATARKLQSHKIIVWSWNN